MKTTSFTIRLLFALAGGLAPLATAQTVTPISQIRTQVDKVNYVPTDTTTLFTAEGVVTTHVNLTTGTNVLFHIQDSTAGIAVFWRGGLTKFVPKAGDLVRVTAPLTHFNGLLEMGPTTATATHSVTLISTGNPLPAPTPLEFRWQTDPALMELQEGKLVVASNVVVDAAGGSFTSGSNVTITNATGETFVLRVDARTDIGGKPKPGGPVTVTGVLIQFDSSDPRTSGYQLLPTRYADIVAQASQPPPPVVQIVATNIARLRTLVDAVNYLPSDTTTLYSVEGIVTTHANLTGVPSALFYVQDATAGIAVFWRNGADVFVPTAGDRVRVVGPLGHFNGLLEFLPVAGTTNHSVTLVSKNNPLPAPVPLEFAWQNDPSQIEKYEGSYVVASNVVLNVAEPTLPRTGTIEMADAQGQTLALFVNAQTDIGGQAKPVTSVTVLGVLGQFDTSGPRTSAYQLIPTRFADILAPNKAPTIRFTNVLENLVRPGDLPMNTFEEISLRPGEKVTITAQITDASGKTISLKPNASGLPVSWQTGALSGNPLTATLTFQAGTAEAGKLFTPALEAVNDVATNTTSWKIYVPSVAEQQVILSEFLANPATTNTAPHFNPLKRAEPAPNPSYQDEYVELANLGSADVNLLRWSISDSSALRHRFFESFLLPSSNAVVVYGGPLNGFAPVLNVPSVPASEDVFGFGLNNSGGDSILIRNADGNLISRVIYSTLPGDASMTRYPNLNGDFVSQLSVSTNRVSPGTQWNGRLFSESAPTTLLASLSINASLLVGGGLKLSWKTESGRTYSVWRSDQVAGPYAAVASNLTFAGAEGQFTESDIRTASARFYRIRSP